MGAESILDIIFRTRKTGDGDTKAKAGLKGLSSAFSDLTGVNLTAAGAIALTTSALKYSVDQAIESQNVHAQLNAVLESTGQAAGMTAEDIDAMATQLSMLSAVEDDAIVAGANVMLTFTRIGQQVFPDAMEAALNLSKAMGQDLQSSAVQVGKALNDPLTGMTALQRVGVTFTQDQEDMIKTLQESGDVMGAQKVVLEELNKEFGGSAAAAADTYAGKLQKLNNTVGNLAEKIGGPLIDGLSKAADTLVLLTSRNDLINAALRQHNDEVALTAETYAEYEAEILRASEASQQFDKITLDAAAGLIGEADTIAAAREQLGLMTEAQWAAAQAHAEAARIAEESAPSIEAMGAGYDAAAQRADAMSTAAHNMGQTTLDLLGAQDALASAEEKWREGAGGDMARMLEERLGPGKRYEEALAAIDEVSGTNLLTEEQLRVAQEKLATEYSNGSITAEEFGKRLEGLNKQFMPFDEDVEKATKLVEDLKGKMEELARKWWISVGLRDETGLLGRGVNTEDTEDLLTPRAAGGPTRRGKAYLVGENGPEVFRDSSSGTIIPNGAGMGGTLIGTVIINNGMDLAELEYRVREWTRGR